MIKVVVSAVSPIRAIHAVEVVFTNLTSAKAFADYAFSTGCMAAVWQGKKCLEFRA